MGSTSTSYDGIDSEFTKLIVLEDWTDADFDDFYWVVEVEEVDVDINIDSDNDGNIDTTNEMVDHDDNPNTPEVPFEELAPGKILAVGMNQRIPVEVTVELPQVLNPGDFTYELDFDEAVIKIFDHEQEYGEPQGAEIARNTNITSGTAISLQGLVWAGATIYVDGYAVGSSDIVFSVKHEGEVYASDKIRVLVALDLDTDSDNDGTIDATSQEDECEGYPDDPGKVVQQDGAAAETALTFSGVDLDSTQFEDYSIQLIASPELNVWADASKTTRLTAVDPDAADNNSNGIKDFLEDDSLGETYIWSGSSNPPTAIYVEGSSSTGERKLHWRFIASDGTTILAHDTVKFSVIVFDIDTDSDNDGTIDGTPQEEDIEDDLDHPGKIVILDGNPAEAEIASLDVDLDSSEFEDYSVRLIASAGLNVWADSSKANRLNAVDPDAADNNSNDIPDFLEDGSLVETYIWSGSNSPPTIIYVEGSTSTGERMLHWRFIASDGTTVLARDSVKYQVVKATLNTVTFDATDHGDFHTITPDPIPTSPVSFAAPHWKDDNFDGDASDAGEHDYPLCYTRSGTVTGAAGDVMMTADVAIKVWGAPGTSENIRVKGYGTAAGQNILLTDATSSATFSGGLITASLVSDEALPNTVSDSTVSLELYISLNSGSTWSYVGMSDNRLYLTWDDPTSAAPYETSVYVGCHAASGLGGLVNAANNLALVTETYADGFAGCSVRRVSDNMLMSYSHSGDYALDAAEMLGNDDGEGQCTAWADLLVQVLAAQGIDSHNSNIYPVSPYDKFRVKLMPAQGSGGADYTTTDFYFHQVVRIDGIDALDDTIFDPSYGTLVEKTDARSVEQKYEDVNIVEVRLYPDNWIDDPSGSPYWVWFTP